MCLAQRIRPRALILGRLSSTPARRLLSLFFPLLVVEIQLVYERWTSLKLKVHADGGICLQSVHPCYLPLDCLWYKMVITDACKTLNSSGLHRGSDAGLRAVHSYWVLTQRPRLGTPAPF